MSRIVGWMLHVAVLLLKLSAVRAADPPPHGLRVPPGFEVVEFADDKLAADIYCLTVSPDGRVLVSGRGYVRQLVDDDGDGRADRALDFAAAPKDGAMGLFWERNTLYCVGDGGLRVYRDAGGAGRSRPSELLFRCRTGGEHHAHAVARGPDGWLYLLVGDGTGITATHATLPTSPVRQPVAGCVLRFPPDLRGCEIVADGFRNAYGMDWNADGELFTFDSDNERCVSLPWYEHTRCYHVQPGGHHGWMSSPFAAFWRRPPTFVDTVAPLRTLGRGSPTGVVCYKHGQFPPRYRGGLFLLDWTFGQVHFLPLARAGSSYAATPEVFLKSVGENGFAPTAAAVHPLTGDLYLAIGGRGTRGAVYRVRYTEGAKRLDPAEARRWQPRPRSLDWRPGLGAEIVRDATSADAHARRRALELAVRHASRLTPIEREKVILSAAEETDRRIRQLTARLLGGLDVAEQDRLDQRLTTPAQRITRALAWPTAEIVDLARDRTLPAALRLDAVRLTQIALGDLGDPKRRGTVWEGYARRVPRAVPDGVRRALRAAFPSGDADLDRELTRTLVLVEDDDPTTLATVAARLTADSDPVDDVHTLIVLARLAAERPAVVTQQVSNALLDLDAKVEARRLNRDTNWPLRLAELHAGLAGRDSRLNRALVEHPAFGRPDHAVFCRCPGFDRQRAARTFVGRAQAGRLVWNAEMVQLVGELPAAVALPVLRGLWGEQGLDEVLLPVLARHGEATDRERFVTGLTSAQLATVAVALGAVERLPLPPAGEVRRDEALALVRCLRQLGTSKEEERLRVRALARLAGHGVGKTTTTEAAVAWFRVAYPALAARVADADGVDVAGWRKRLAAVDWSKGDANRGQSVFVKASCAACHSGAAAVGPDLLGVTGRFSRDDLFTAILQPSKDVSPRYRTTQLTTADGKVYQGIIVYEAVDSVLLLTGPGQTVRLVNAQISDRRLTATSLMPTGLLDRLADADLADLYAYLKELNHKEHKEHKGR
ncbi:MAG: c-type cytochrome [Gemmataceae bacterium]